MHNTPKKDEGLEYRDLNAEVAEGDDFAEKEIFGLHGNKILVFLRTCSVVSFLGLCNVCVLATGKYLLSLCIVSAKMASYICRWVGPMR